jgi:hypothetical protein
MALANKNTLVLFPVRFFLHSASFIDLCLNIQNRAENKIWKTIQSRLRSLRAEALQPQTLMIPALFKPLTLWLYHWLQSQAVFLYHVAYKMPGGSSLISSRGQEMSIEGVGEDRMT